ncbi:stage III sporulation protein AD [Pueribacillus theae]|uniref:Stage III sporulation protein AD n=2 Tax=Pueribacillus theae TaxID=2171751 RepID=A0A2U1K8C1_9BACI|nr:stage III sporulation protein AD [Pueribacillus theae]
MQITGLGLIATFLILVIKEQNPVFAFSITLIVGVIIFIFLIDQIQAIFLLLNQLADQANINLVYVETILKIIGVAYIAEFGAQITKDAGQGSIASKIELAGKLIILGMAIPILKVIIETVLGLLPT